ncbi:Ribosomal small subunit Rsm22 [Desulfovibrio sp. X2]|uniref:small ribosomal subunit Rsm22 family protein n=1 Tax=Desulfovibrio sp. X2 TaxID=941449 RepID=UPI000358CCB3|nr:small ribosomal subunit Rsm22 family protein [Desulfovibrio sp. X2]EPR41418.1 Ribosomal small subunit Rsm22 [Desulfovibrio sp. X2]
MSPETPSALFFPMPDDAIRLLGEYGAFLKEAMPLKPKYARNLPFEVRELSASLTDERAEAFAPDYMTRPGTLSAYLHYFHPWNLYRLTRLLATLPLDLPEGARVVDLGAGPLTVVQALWMARPDLRTRRIEFTCIDRAGKSLRYGMDLFRRLAPDSPWRIQLLDEHLFKMPHGRYDLITAANVLNELAEGNAAQREPDLEELAGRLCSHLADTGSLLLVEPGTRLAARRLIALRHVLIEERGLTVASPCPHQTSCPMPGTGRLPWCHFTFSTHGAPLWLTHLAQAASLIKNRLSLSFVHAGRSLQKPDETRARVISDAFALPGDRRGQYCCTARGLALVVLEGFPLPSGALIKPAWMEPEQRDPKSGALMAEYVPATRKGPARGSSAPRAERGGRDERGGQERRQERSQERGPIREQSGRGAPKQGGHERMGRQEKRPGQHSDKRSQSRPEGGKPFGERSGEPKRERRDERFGDRREKRRDEQPRSFERGTDRFQDRSSDRKKTSGKPWDREMNDASRGKKPGGFKPRQESGQDRGQGGAKWEGKSGKTFKDKPARNNADTQRDRAGKPAHGKPCKGKGGQAAGAAQENRQGWRQDKNPGAKPFSRDDAQRTGQDRKHEGKPRADKTRGDKPRTGRPMTGKPSSAKPAPEKAHKPRQDAPERAAHAPQKPQHTPEAERNAPRGAQGAKAGGKLVGKFRRKRSQGSPEAAGPKDDE